MSAIVLCGGASRRMGTDKAWVKVGETTLLQRTCANLEAVTNEIVVVAAPEQPLPLLPDTIHIARDRFPGEGPLGGFLTGLQFLEQLSPNRPADRPVWLTACDTPYCQAEIIQELLAARKHYRAVVVRESHRIHPLSAIYQTDVSATVARLFEAGCRRMTSVVDEVSTNLIDVDQLRDIDPQLNFLRPVNTPEELERVRADGLL